MRREQQKRKQLVAPIIISPSLFLAKISVPSQSAPTKINCSAGF